MVRAGEIMRAFNVYIETGNLSTHSELERGRNKSVRNSKNVTSLEIHGQKLRHVFFNMPGEID